MNQMVAALTRIKETGFTPSHTLDIGAYEGDWAKAASVIFPDTSILMIEAQAQKQDYLERLHQYKASTFQYQMTMLGKENKENVAFYQIDANNNSTGSSMYEEQTDFPRKQINLPLRKLDSVLEAYPDRKFSLAKIDVQGAELDVLQGGSRLLQEAEFIIMELSLMNYNRSAPLLAEVISYMDVNGFAAVDIFEPKRDSKHQLVQIDYSFIRKGSPFTPKLSL
jgi:FkbM family methyltransferase